MSDMNVGNVSGVYSAVSQAVTGAAQTAPEAAAATPAPGAEVAAVFEKSSGSEQKATYSINKMSAEDRAALVQQLKQDQVDRQNQLAEIVRKMFTDQAGVSKLSEIFSPENLGISIRNTTTIQNGNEKVYVALTGDQVAITNIKKY